MDEKEACKSGIDKKHFDRMTKRESYKDWVIYPENRQKGAWDLFMTFVLIFTCVMTPLSIAFNDIDKTEPESNTLDYIIDLLFGIDIIVIFNTAYYNDDNEIIDCRKQIACSYLKGWFIIDLLAIIPFDQVINANDYNQLARVARVGRLYKLVKLTRLFRMLKVVK
jgi:hypothetical protein